MCTEAYQVLIHIVEQYANPADLEVELAKLCRSIRRTEDSLQYQDFGNLLLQMTMNKYIYDTIPRPEITQMFNDLMRLYKEKYTAMCEIEELFVICKNSGYLVAHHKRDNRSPNLDTDLVAGMLTAIQAFVHHAFDLEEWENISIIHMGKIKMMIEHTENLYAAIIFTGPDSDILRDNIRKLLSNIETEHLASQTYTDGSEVPVGEIQVTLDQFFCANGYNTTNIIDRDHPISRLG